jgi:hypothetical protein
MESQRQLVHVMLRLTFAFLLVAAAYPAAVALLHGTRGSVLFIATFTFMGAASGLPLLVWCIRRNRDKCWHASLAGAAIGAMAPIPFSLLIGGPLSAIYFSAIFALLGAVHGGVLWILGIWRNDSLAKWKRIQPIARSERESNTTRI